MDDEPINDIAVLKTRRAINLGEEKGLPLCFENTLVTSGRRQRISLSSCGLGSTSDKKGYLSFPLTLKVNNFPFFSFASVFKDDERNNLYVIFKNSV